MPRTALRGMIGGILGLEYREDDDLLSLEDRCGLRLLSPVRRVAQELSLYGKKWLGSRGDDSFHRHTSIELIVQPRYRVYYAGPRRGTGRAVGGAQYARVGGVSREHIGNRRFRGTVSALDECTGKPIMFSPTDEAGECELIELSDEGTVSCGNLTCRVDLAPDRGAGRADRPLEGGGRRVWPV
jgi:hypothetical protein